jgi:hypothetical protein
MKNHIWDAVIAFILGTVIAATVSTSATQQGLFAVFIGIPIFISIIIGKRLLTRYPSAEARVQSLTWEGGHIWAWMTVAGIVGILAIQNLNIPATSHRDFYIGGGVAIIVFVIGYAWDHFRRTSFVQ